MRSYDMIRNQKKKKKKFDDNKTQQQIRGIITLKTLLFRLFGRSIHFVCLHFNAVKHNLAVLAAQCLILLNGEHISYIYLVITQLFAI